MQNAREVAVTVPHFSPLQALSTIQIPPIHRSNSEFQGALNLMCHGKQSDEHFSVFLFLNIIQNAY